MSDMFDVFEESDSAFWNGSRYVLRATLKNYPPEDVLKEQISGLLWEVFDKKTAQGNKPAAVCIFLYSDRNASNAPLATGELAPQGIWANADSKRPRDEFEVNVQIFDLYRQPSVIPVEPGDIVVSVDGPVQASETAESWDVSIFEIPPKTKLKVIEVRRFTAGETYQYLRLKVGLGEQTGWIGDQDVSLVTSPPAEKNVDHDVEIIWDPELLKPEEYKILVRALGDVVRASGGVGLKLVDSDGFRTEVRTLVT